MGTKRHYARAFQERAVKLSYERYRVKALASELGISAERLYKWRAEFAELGDASFDFIFLLRTSAIHANMMALGLSSIQGHGVERLSDEGKRVKELEKKLRNTQMELGKPNEAMVGASLLELRLARRFQTLSDIKKSDRRFGLILSSLSNQNKFNCLRS